MHIHAFVYIYVHVDLNLKKRNTLSFKSHRLSLFKEIIITRSNSPNGKGIRFDEPYKETHLQEKI